MRTFLTILLLYSLFFAHAQEGMDIKVGGISGFYTYKDLDNYADSYNAGFVDEPDFMKPLSIKKFAVGYQFGLGYQLDRFNVDLNIATVKTGVSRAEWKYFDRCIQLKSFLFDMDGGVYLMDELSPFKLSIGLGVTIISTQIQAFTDYGEFKSYGSENFLNGVWSNWKGYTTAILKGTYNLDEEHWRLFFVAKFPIQNNKISSTGYDYNAQFTSSGDVFPADNNKPYEYENRLSENFRYINFSLGISYFLPFD